MKKNRHLCSSSCYSKPLWNAKACSRCYRFLFDSSCQVRIFRLSFNNKKRSKMKRESFSGYSTFFHHPSPFFFQLAWLPWLEILKKWMHSKMKQLKSCNSRTRDHVWVGRNRGVTVFRFHPAMSNWLLSSITRQIFPLLKCETKNIPPFNSTEFRPHSDKIKK